jgi:protein Tex
VQPGMLCPGVVTNVTNFGAFVDIGVHQDGLCHISQLSDRFVKDPKDVVNAGDRVTVRVLEVKLDKKQIALTMKSERPAEAPAAGPAPIARARPAGGDRGDRRPAPGPAPKPATPFNNPFAAALADANKPRRR